MGGCGSGDRGPDGEGGCDADPAPGHAGAGRDE